jgi:hypothetical protein
VWFSINVVFFFICMLSKGLHRVLDLEGRSNFHSYLNGDAISGLQMRH